MKRYQKLTEKISIKAPRQLIFDFTQDYDNRLKWDTFLRKAELMNGATTAGKGVHAYCVSRHGMGMETAYVTYQRPKVTAIKMTRGPLLFKTFAGSWAFEELSPMTTEVTFTYSFSLPFIIAPASGFIRWILSKNVRQRLVDLRTCIENGAHT